MQLSVWEKESFFSPKDLVIVGSGFVGLWSAYFYKKKYPNHRVLIVERGMIPTGASTRNAGFACFGSITELLEDARTSGIDPMLELVEQRYKGLQLLREILPAENFDFEICGGYDLLQESDVAKHAGLKDKMEWLNQLLAPIVGQPVLFEFADHKIRDFGFSGIASVVENKLEGYLHSGKLCQQLLSLVNAAGVTVLNGFDVKQIEHSDQGVEVTISDVRVRTDRLLICTNAFARQLIPELDIVPARGQIFVTAPIHDLKLKGTFHYDEGYYYFRNLGNRLLIGGARNKDFDNERTTEFGITGKIQEELHRFVTTHILPHQSFEITDRWSGIMAMGTEKKPIVKKVSANTWCAVRMSGMGVALAPVIGQKLALEL